MVLSLQACAYDATALDATTSSSNLQKSNGHGVYGDSQYAARNLQHVLVVIITVIAHTPACRHLRKLCVVASSGRHAHELEHANQHEPGRILHLTCFNQIMSRAVERAVETESTAGRHQLVSLNVLRGAPNVDESKNIYDY